MRLAVDINNLHRPLTGIGRYVQGLLGGTSELEPDDEVVLLYRDEPAVPLPDRFDRIRVPGSSETWWAQMSLPRAARAADVLLCPGVRAPALHRVPVVLVVHDVLYATHPEYFSRFDRAYMRTLMRIALPRCEGVIAVSEATAEGVRRHFRVRRGRLTVIPNGVDSRFHPREGVAPGLDVPERYILFVGTLERRKNVDVLLQAHTRARERGLEHELVLAGKRGWRAVEPEGARYLGHVPDDVLPLLYAGADVVVYPSSYEGFGLPVLEGMASGVPVVTTTAPGVAEVAGEAALLVPPRDVDALTEALLRATQDGQMRADLVRRGLERAAQFSWKETARRTLEACRQAAAS